MLIAIILYVTLLLLKHVNVVTIVIILKIPMQKCVPDVVKDLNVKIFNLMWRTNETKNIKCMKHVNVNAD